MKKPVFVYALAFGLAIASGASAQDSGEYAECEQLLNSPPFDTLLTRNEGQDYGELNSDRLGEALLGVKCSRDQIVEYFLSAGWEIV